MFHLDHPLLRVMFPLATAAFVVVLSMSIAAFFIGVEYNNNYVMYAAKPTPCFLLVPFILLHTGFRDFLGLGTAAGLMLSFCGDTLLMLPEQMKLFKVGMAAFLMAHLCFIGALSDNVDLTRRLWYLLVVLALVVGAAVAGVECIGFGPMMVMLCVYLAAETCTQWRAAARIGHVEVTKYHAIWWTPSPLVGQWCMYIGTVFFTVSDICLGLDRFCVRIPLRTWVVMSTYWLGQLLISYGAIRRSPRDVSGPLFDAAYDSSGVTERLVSMPDPEVLSE